MTGIYYFSIVLYTLASWFLAWMPTVQSSGKVGSIVCQCNTWDCEEQSRVLCTTDFQCYVQVTFSENGEPDVRYGCLSQHSILCQNPKPKNYHGNWPIVQCCSDDFCNKDLMPTEPPEWHIGKSSSTASSSPTSSTTSPSSTSVSPTNFSSEQRLFHSSPSSGRRSSINPFYIAFPVVGAVILILLIIFAVYILRRQPSSSREYKYHSALKPKPHEIRHNVPSQQQNNHNGLGFDPHHKKQSPVMAVEPFMRVPCNGRDVEKGGNVRDREGSNGFVTDGEGSSTGSERKLLV